MKRQMRNGKKSIRGAMIALAAQIALCVQFARADDGQLFFWKGASWGKFDDPANWDVGAQGSGNPDSLIPGENDVFDFASYADIDLNGKTFTVKRRGKDLTSSDVQNAGSAASWAYLNLTNGTLVVTGHHSKRLNFNIWNGATYRLAGAYADAYGLPDESRQTIHSGGRFEVVKPADILLYGMYITIQDGGYMYFDPNRLHAYPSSSAQKTMQITNNGTLEAPNGIYFTREDWGEYAYTSEYFPRFYQNGGVLKLGGNFGREDRNTAKQVGLTLSGGTVEITNSVSFVNMSANPPTVPEGSALTFDVKADSVFNIAGLAIGERVSITKTGSGDLKFGNSGPSSLAVAAGKVIFTRTIPAPEMSFAEGTHIRVEEELMRIDECEGFSNTVFSVGEALLSVGFRVLCSEDEDILAHAKNCLDAQLLAAGVQAEGRVENGVLVVRSVYPYTFNADTSSDLTDPSAWRCLSVPTADKPVRIRGTGIVNYSSESTRFASITVEEGATLSVAGGTAESPVDLPPIELAYDARLLLTEGSVVQITNVFTCLCNAETLPVFEVATNATAIVQTPGIGWIRSAMQEAQWGEDHGFRLKNVALRWYGTIQTYFSDTGRSNTHCRLLLGWAENGETSYISVDCRGGRYIAASEPNCSLKCRTPLAIAIPNAGGTVVPVGTLYFRDYSCTQRTVSAAANPDYYVPGLFIGRWSEVDNGNPASVRFDVAFEGSTDVNLNGVFRIGGGAHVMLRGPGVKWRYDRKAWNDNDFPRAVVFHDSGSLELEDGAYLGATTADDGNRGVVAKADGEGHKVLTASNSSLELLNWSGNGKNVAEVNDSVLEIGYLRSANTLGNITGVFNGFKSVAISNDFTIAAADVGRGNPGKTSVTSIENWNRRVFVASPLTGTGSLVVSNKLTGAHAVYSMTVTVTNGANTATGKAFAAQTASGAATALVFADGANWAGEVIADGRVSLTNLVSEGGAAEVSFGALRAGSAFPLRVWKTGGAIVANDKVNLASALPGSLSFAFVEMDEPLAIGDGFAVGLYPAECALPRNTDKLRYSAAPCDVDGFVTLMGKYSKPGMTVEVR